MTGNNIKDEGTKAKSEVLKKNTTLTSLNVFCNGKRKTNEKERVRDNGYMVDNEIGDEGAKSMSEMLKTNTTLKTLNMQCKVLKVQRNLKRSDEWSADTRTGDEEAKVLSESLKDNTTLTSLFLISEEEGKGKRKKGMITEWQTIILEMMG